MNRFFKHKRASRLRLDPQAICVWGPSGAPGRSTLAVNLAGELALSGANVLLVDLDTHSPVIADHFGLLDEKPGIAAAYRLIGQGRLDLEQLERLSQSFQFGDGRLFVLTGLRSAARWPEITRDRTQSLVQIAKDNFDFMVIDVAADLEPGIRQVGGVVDRNAAARTAIEIADRSVAVFSADPIGVRRLTESFEQLRPLDAEPLLVANRFRPAALGLSAKRQLEDTIMQLCKLEISAFVPLDSESCDRAILDCVPLVMMKRTSKARQAIAQFVRLNFREEAAESSRAAG